MSHQLNGATRLYPIVGDPIKYAESPVRLTAAFGERGHNGACIPLEVPTAGLDAVMTGLAAIPNVDGILVTMPHKSTAFAYCTTSSERSAKLSVVSVIRRNPDGTWHGDMLDGLAFVKAQVTAALISWVRGRCSSAQEVPAARLPLRWLRQACASWLFTMRMSRAHPAWSSCLQGRTPE